MDFLGELVSSEPVDVSVVSDYEFAETSKVLRRQGYRFRGVSATCPYPVVISVNS